MKSLTKRQIILTVVVLIAFALGMMLAFWLHSMAFADPVQQQWQPRIAVISDVLWFGTIIPWLPFTTYHVIIRVRRKSST